MSHLKATASTRHKIKVIGEEHMLVMSDRQRGQHRGKLVSRLVAERKLVGQTPSSLAREIPYLLPSFGKTTQYIEVRLYMTVQNIVTSAGTAYNSVLNLQASVFNNFTDFAGIFDEYRVIEGMVAYMPMTSYTPVTWNGSYGPLVAVIDYGISTALGSTTAAVSHDNKQFFQLVNNGSQKINPNYGVAKWPVKLERLPDQDWLLASNSAQNFAYWKPYMVSTDSPGAGTTGFVWGWMDFQFRGMSA